MPSMRLVVKQPSPVHFMAVRDATPRVFAGCATPSVTIFVFTATFQFVFPAALPTLSETWGHPTLLRLVQRPFLPSLLGLRTLQHFMRLPLRAKRSLPLLAHLAARRVREIERPVPWTLRRRAVHRLLC